MLKLFASTGRRLGPGLENDTERHSSAQNNARIVLALDELYI